jgi:CheY-like chemotaxis protein
MHLGNHLLVVADSQFMLEVLGRLLFPHFSKIFFASSYRDALKELEQNPSIDTVICDVVLPDGDGFQLLEELANEPKAMPKSLLITARWNEDDWRRALSLGAIGCLPKPITVRSIRTTLSMPSRPIPRDPRHRTLASAWVIDPERQERMLCLGIHDISATGVLLDTTGALPVGTELELEIVYSEDQAVRVKGTVVRVQEPSWLTAAGVAVHFDWVESREKLSQLLGGGDHEDGCT